MDAAPPLVTGPIPIYFRAFKFLVYWKKRKEKEIVLVKNL